MRIKAVQLLPGFVGGKLPVDRASFFRALLSPGLSNLVKLRLRGPTLRQALPTQGGKRPCGPVQPTAVYRRRVARDLLGPGPRLLGCKRLLAGPRCMGP